jgi:hypothetical protein
MGTGEGVGMAVIVVVSGILMVFVGLGAYYFPKIRNVETILPDHNAVT